MTSTWVTGAAGFIGKHMVRQLLASNRSVYGIDVITAENAYLSNRVAGWSSDGLSFSALEALAGKAGLPAEIYHLAGGSAVGPSFIQPLRDFEASVGSTVTLLEWVRVYSPATRVIIVSSAAVYGDLHKEPIRDDAATSPFSPYGAHKFAMEGICRGWASSFGLNVIIVRLFSVYGPGLKKQLLWDLCTRLENGEQNLCLGGTGEELRDWTHVDDVVRALIVASPFASVFAPVVNAGGSRIATVRAVASAVISAFGRSPDDLSFSGKSRSGDPFSLFAAPGWLSEQSFSWNMPLNDGIKGYVNWYQKQSAEMS